MIQGFFYENIPIVQITVGSGSAVQTPYVVLDTGFTGDLQVTSQIANDLGLVIRGNMPVGLADGRSVSTPVSLAIAEMEGAINLITVLIADSSPLIGISFLTKFNYKAIVDCKHRTVQLEKV